MPITSSTIREKNVMKVFNVHKKAMLKSMGHNITSSTILNDKGNQLFNNIVANGNMYLGTFSQDNLPWHKIKNKKKPIMAIINTDVANKPGVHWVALYITPKTIYIWDSYGRDTNKLLPVFAKQMKFYKIKSKDADPDKNQTNTSKICGQLCLSFLSTVKQVGIRNALLI
jgi:hypothetical protein